MFKFNIHPFDGIVRILLVLLPFSTVITVFSGQKLDLPIIGYYKEWLLFILLIILAIEKLRWKLVLRFTPIDLCMILYIAYMIGISLFTTGSRGIAFGGKYDFLFLIAFWITYHGSVFLEKPISWYIKTLLFSIGTMLFLSGLLKWPLSEDLLLYLWYCGNPSAWHDCSGVPPIFHGIEWANARRFQWILDNPNTMWAYLIFFSGLLAYYTRAKKEWYFVLGVIFLGLLIMILYTYSRSAFLGILWAYGILILFNLRSIFKKYLKESLIIISTVCLIGVGILVQYSGTLGAIIGREGSTKWHLERMIIGVERFVSAPLGQGLGSAGPGYRKVINSDIKNGEISDTFYIPESWYIQQFIEWGIVGGISFLILMWLFFIQLVRTHATLGAMLFGILVMNFFLHTFESSVLVLPLFLIIGIILSKNSSTPSVWSI